MQVKVFESGCAKWVKIGDDPGMSISYTSNETDATLFDFRHLHSADVYFTDFRLYQRTLKAVPVGTNSHPSECGTVKAFIKKHRNHEMEG